MAYNLEQIRENVRNRLDDEDFEQEYLDRAINYAQWQITNKHHLSFMEESTNLNVSTNDTEVNFPADYHKTLQLVVTTPVDMRADISRNYIPYRDFVTTYISPADNPVNMPYNWSVFARQFKFAAPADQNYVLRLDYLRKSEALADDADVPDIPEEFGELLEIGAYMRIAKREDDYDVKSQESLDYNMMLIDLLNVYGADLPPRGIRRMKVN